MNNRLVLCGLVLVSGLLAVSAITPSAAQPIPTANAATIDAFVQQRFDATHAYAAFGDLNVTIDAAFVVAQTATAAVPTLLPPTTAADSTPLPTPSPIYTADPFSIVESSMVLIPAVQAFQMGTTEQEIGQAVAQCTLDEQGNCTIDMGRDSLPLHTLALAAFSIQRYEVTASDYTAFLNQLGPGSHLNGCEGNPCALTRAEDETALIDYDGSVYSNLGGLLPMYKVTWYGAKAFCEAIGYRLPTEAQWEYAARGTDGRIYPWGTVWDPLNARTSIPVTTEVGPFPVGSYPSGVSPFGLFDMAGNVAEWVSDWYDPAFYGAPDASVANPTGPTIGTEKVIRGGSWDSKPFFGRVVHRQSLDPLASGSWIGFRCAADASAAPATAAASGVTEPVSAQPTLPALNTPSVSSTTPSVEATAAG